MARPLDDPDDPWRSTGLAGRVKRQAAELSAEIGEREGAAPWVQSVVVLWGEFPERFTEAERVVHIGGEYLPDWLSSGRPPA